MECHSRGITTHLKIPFTETLIIRSSHSVATRFASAKVGVIFAGGFGTIGNFVGAVQRYIKRDGRHRATRHTRRACTTVG